MTDELKTLQRQTGLRIFLDAPDGVEVYAPGEREPAYVGKNKPQALAFLQGVAWVQEYHRTATAPEAGSL